MSTRVNLNNGRVDHLVNRKPAVPKVKKGQEIGDKKEHSTLEEKIARLGRTVKAANAVEQIEEAFAPECKLLHSMQHYGQTLKALTELTGDEMTPKERLRGFHQQYPNFEVEYQQAKDEKQDGDWAMATAIGTIKEALRELGGDLNKVHKLSKRHKKPMRAYAHGNAYAEVRYK